MNTKKFISILIIYFFAAGAVLAQKANADYIKDLKSDDEKKAVEACEGLGKAVAKEAIDALIETLTNNENIKVRIAAAIALGRMEEKGKPTTALKGAVENDESNDVVYAALLSILNLKDFANPDAKKALEYCEENKSDDVLIKDIIDRIKKIMQKT
ncbi:MAG: HEAT repeat domain-containing protein [Spirochaetia bacterium]|nr:HEAT repeat domain-containing protein [Spirochaetia bacterium]